MIARHRLALSAAALLVATVQPGFGEDMKGKALNVTTPDGLTVSAQEQALLDWQGGFSRQFPAGTSRSRPHAAPTRKPGVTKSRR